MTLRKFKGVSKINRTPVFSCNAQTTNLRRVLQEYILIDPDRSVVAFKIQDGPIREKGKNGVQIDDCIAFCRQVIDNFNKDFPCDENRTALLNLDCALDALAERKKNREKRNVEGKNKL